MAVSSPPSVLATKSDSSGGIGSITFDASFSPSADHILMVSVGSLGDGTEPSHSISDTFGFTWNLIEERANGEIRLSTWWADTGGSPGSGNVTVTFGENVEAAALAAYETDGHDTTTPISESAQDETQGSSLSINLADFASGNLIIGAFCSKGDSDIAPGTGETELLEINGVTVQGPAVIVVYGEDTSVDVSNLETRITMGSAFEIAQDGGGGGGIPASVALYHQRHHNRAA